MTIKFTLWYRSDGELVSVADCGVNDSGSLPTRGTARFSVHCKVIELPLSMMQSLNHNIYAAEFIISIVNSVKMVNMP